MKKLTLFIMLLAGFTTKAQTITTIAGTGTSGTSGDGGAATAAQVTTSQGIAVDTFGNIFFAEGSAPKVRKINTAGIISTWVGNGTVTAGTWAAGPATSFGLSAAQNGLTIDKFGNLYLNTGDRFILKITPAGWLTWKAGRGSAFGGDGGPAMNIACGLNGDGVSIDTAGNLFIADRSNQRIRMVNTGDTINTIAGTGVAGYSGDGGAATAAKFDGPFFVCADYHGNVFVSDFENHRIRKISSSGTITNYAGNGMPGFVGDGGQATAAMLYHPFGLACDTAGNLYFSDLYNNRIRKINPAGIISTIAGTSTAGFAGDGGPASAAQLNRPQAIAVDVFGNIYFSDASNRRLRKITYCPPPDAGTVVSPSGVCLGGTIHVVNSATGGVWSVKTGHASVSGGLIHGVSIGLDTIVYTVHTACGTRWAIKPVTVNTVPTAISGGNSVCTGKYLYLSNGVAGGSWSSGNTVMADVTISTGIVSAYNAGTAVITYTLPTGCYTTQALTVNQSPTGITGDTTLCADSTRVLHVFPAGGVWRTDNAAVAAIDSVTGNVTGVAAGTTVISYVMPTGCSSQRTVVITDCSVSAVKEVAGDQLGIFPNPAHSVITVTSATAINDIVIYDRVGRTVCRLQPHGQAAEVDVTDLVPGLYVLRLNGTVYRSFVKY